MKKTTANSVLRKAGLKVTLPRISILEILEEAEQHQFQRSPAMHNSTLTS